MTKWSEKARLLGMDLVGPFMKPEYLMAILVFTAVSICAGWIAHQDPDMLTKEPGLNLCGLVLSFLLAVKVLHDQYRLGCIRQLTTAIDHESIECEQLWDRIHVHGDTSNDFMCGKNLIRGLPDTARRLLSRTPGVLRWSPPWSKYEYTLNDAEGRNQLVHLLGQITAVQARIDKSESERMYKAIINVQDTFVKLERTASPTNLAFWTRISIYAFLLFLPFQLLFLKWWSILVTAIVAYTMCVFMLKEEGTRLFAAAQADPGESPKISTREQCDDTSYTRTSFSNYQPTTVDHTPAAHDRYSRTIPPLGAQSRHYLSISTSSTNSSGPPTPWPVSSPSSQPLLSDHVRVDSDFERQAALAKYRDLYAV